MSHFMFKVYCNNSPLAVLQGLVGEPQEGDPDKLHPQTLVNQLAN